MLILLSGKGTKPVSLKYQIGVFGALKLTIGFLLLPDKVEEGGILFNFFL